MDYHAIKVGQYISTRRYGDLWAPTSGSCRGLVAFGHLEGPLDSCGKNTQKTQKKIWTPIFFIGKGREGKGREGKGREGKGREGKGREGKGREGKGREGKGREGKGREGKGREGKGREGKGREGKGREGKGREGKGTRLSFFYVDNKKYIIMPP